MDSIKDGLSERSTEALLSRLNTNGSPTFHDYGNKPPNFVLDLGCGAGGWVIEAATVWRHSQITGFDLIDTESLIDTEIDPAVAKNITWLRGNLWVAVPTPPSYLVLITDL
jgi:trans-aconitate methyltransferase